MGRPLDWNFRYINPFKDEYGQWRTPHEADYIQKMEAAVEGTVTDVTNHDVENYIMWKHYAQRSDV